MLSEAVYSMGTVVDANITFSKPLKQQVHHIEVTADGTYRCWSTLGFRDKVMKAGTEYAGHMIQKITKTDDSALDKGVCFIII